MAWWTPYWSTEAAMIAATSPVFRARQGVQSTGTAPAPGGGLPPVDFPKAPRSSINRTSTTQEHKLRVTSASDALIPTAYGPCELGGNVFAIGVDGTDLIVGVWFCLGEIEEYTKIYLNDDDVPGTVTVNEYKGTTSQTTDSILANISGYSDDLVLDVDGTDIGVAYIAARIPLISVKGFPRFTAKIKGMKNVYDPRDLSTAYSDNPALCFRNWLKSSVYGPGYDVLDSTVETAADFCDETPGDDWQASTAYSLEDFVVPTTENTHAYECTTAGTSGGTEPTWGTTIGGTTNDGTAVWTCRNGRRRTVGMVMDRKADISSWSETWRTACGCMVVWGESGIEMIPDKARATDHTITHASGQILETPGIALRIKGQENIPNVIKVVYTETSGAPWRDTWARVADSGVDAGTVPARESIIRMPWVQRKAQAVREATERLNAASLTTVSFDLPVFDEGLKIKAGDIVEVTHPIGLTSKKMRVLQASQAIPGRWLLNLYEYDSSVYSDYVCAEPSYSSFVLNTGIVIDYSDQVTGSTKPADNADVTGNNNQGVSWLNEAVGAVLPVANTDAKCTDANADQTSANNQGVSWLNEAVGAVLPVANTNAKCTDPNADQTSVNTANDTDHVNDADTDVGYSYDCYGDLHMRSGADIGFYDTGDNYRGGIYCGAVGEAGLRVSTGWWPYSTNSVELGSLSLKWLRAYIADTGLYIGNSSDMRFYNDGSWNRLNLTVGNFVICNGSEAMLGCYRNGGIYQYYNGSQKSRTTNIGVTVTGTVTAGCGVLTCDYVFEDDYDLMLLDQLGEFVREKKALPNMTINKGGNFASDVLRQETVEKIEESFCYILQLHKRLRRLEHASRN